MLSDAPVRRWTGESLVQSPVWEGKVESETARTDTIADADDVERRSAGAAAARRGG